MGIQFASFSSSERGEFESDPMESGTWAGSLETPQDLVQDAAYAGADVRERENLFPRILKDSLAGIQNVGGFAGRVLKMPIGMLIGISRSGVKID
jgi:hypothetical protein